ncbi:mitochondrial succinate dehydrogenase cytochrome b560 subunit D [Glonium stellatum]|uniref:Succinate dehydrogenase [ubiquinone] cytochrome b small subunit n=1 Tax=Glonium stellatum TaxID=574774 RepID=A0A8E2EZB9_9PEZI|nr:mitochondrial succinate dehydrogenase cytochrome b560 subunit D [Glonium stellatum]
MASMARLTLLRQACSAAPTKRMASSIARSTINHASPLSRQPLQSAFVRDTLPGASRIATFHTTSRRPILPPLPQKVQGTLNDPTIVPDPSPAHGSYHWSFERLVSAGLVPLTIAPFAAGSLNPLMDATLCALLLVHSHVGFQSSIIDYFPVNRVPAVRSLLMWILRIATITVGVSLYEFETNDVGITEAIKRIWHA